MRFAKRTNWRLESNPLSRLLEAKKAAGEKIFDLTESNPTRSGFHSLKNLECPPGPENFSYDPDPHGLLSARRAVCDYYLEKKIRVLPDQVFLTAGTSEAYAFVFRLLLNPGERALAPRPSYPLLDYLAGLNDARISRYRLRYENGWRMDPKPASARNAKVFILVNPNNPTGHFVRREERLLVNRFCSRNKMAVLSDEVFLDYPFENGAGHSFAGNDECLTFTLSGISKILALPQMKLSWIVVSGPEKETREAIRRLEIIADTFLSVNTPAQNAFPGWMEKRGEIQAEIMKRIFENRNHLTRGTPPLRILKSEGGWYAVIDAAAHGRADEEKIAMTLLKKHNTLAHPGYFYDFAGGAHLVLGLLAREPIFREGMDRLRGELI
ncbi:MAG: pyridoxal phosphate-dependent aminotransferase [Candidatus Omnitrophica bacterium]|nr:pyridoxal phosphate-dependent aminotransferase [Candidatus Omnitrophota bacterium]